MTTELIFRCFKSLRFLVREPATTYENDRFSFFPNDKELIKAQLVVELIDRCHYPPEAIRVDPLFLPVDIAVENGPGRLFSLIRVASATEYKKKEKIIRDLYEAARSCGDDRDPRYLICYTRWYEGDTRMARYTVVDTSAFPTFEAWREADFPVMLDVPKWR